MGLTLNDQHSTMERVHRDNLAPFVAHDVYRMPDQSLVMFGSGLHTDGEPRMSRVVMLTPAFNAEHYIDLAREPFFDYGSVPAAVPTATGGEFALVRQVRSNASGDEARGGAALDFVRVR